MFEWRKIWPNGLPDEGQSPKPGHRMAEEGIPFPWWWSGGTISTVLDVIWGMSDQNTMKNLLVSLPLSFRAFDHRLKLARL